MRLEPAWAVRALEHYLYNYFEEKRRLEDMRENIIDSSPARFQEIGGSGINHMTNPTELKAIKLATNKVILEKEKWIKVVTDLIRYAEEYDKTHGTKYYLLINKKYFDELGEEQICNELNIERATYYFWRKEILRMGINLATAIGLIEYKDFLKKSKTDKAKAK